MRPETAVLHAGTRKDEAIGAVATPIYQTTSYQFRDCQHAENLFTLKELGNIYTRIMNPTCEALECRVAAMEGGVAALALGSGQAAVALAILNLCRPGDNFISSVDICGGTRYLFAGTFSGLGIETRYVNSANPEGFRAATDRKTRCYYAETLASPKLNVFPIREVAEIACEQGVPLIVDNTAAPVVCRPLEHGAAVVTYSGDNYLGACNTSTGGFIVDGGTFDWEADPERFPNLNEPDPSYQGPIWVDAAKPLGPVAYILRARGVLLRDFGVSASPLDAFMLIQGLETLPLRMRRHCENAAMVAVFLSCHAKVSRVIYPGLQTGQMRRSADACLDGGFGALVGFELRDGREAGRRFIAALEMIHSGEKIGDPRTFAVCPATSAGSQTMPKFRTVSGVSEGDAQLSVGIEHIDDIVADLSQALDRA
jgi:O-acetylhomoserine (thiol)-lyase